MSRRPRWLKGDAAYCEVQRTVDRQFFFKPDEEIRQIIGSADPAFLRASAASSRRGRVLG